MLGIRGCGPRGCQGPFSAQRRLEKRLLRTVSDWQGDSLHPAESTLPANAARYLVPWKTVGPKRRTTTSFGSSPRSRPTRYFGKDRNRGARVRMPQSREFLSTNQDWRGQRSGEEYDGSRVGRGQIRTSGQFGVQTTIRSCAMATEPHRRESSRPSASC